MPSFKIILNPTSGRGRGASLYSVLSQTLTDQNLNFEIQKTEYPWHAIKITMQAIEQGVDYVIAAGGDGTVNEVINGFVQAQQKGLTGSAMGVICVGQGNDFAYSMGIPTDWQAGSRLLQKCENRKVDIGKVTGGLYPEGRYFGNGVGIGFDAVVGFEAVKLRPLRGFAAYFAGALRTMMLYYNAPLLRIELDDKVLEQPCLMVSIMNGYRLGGGFFMTPNSQPDDGKLDICLVGSVKRTELLGLIEKFTRGTQGSHPAVSFARSSHIKVTALDGTIPAHTDGETLCTKEKEILVEITPYQLDLIYAKPG
ncbi:MAG: diacylglycerol kinase family lipid kinase [Anaerolineaceae bacterium]|nr:diacylglycerol kinase family lipid kinase [Anaerolineaceae bacterium]